MLEDDRPLVTFALCAYNQENFIREAVRGAFAQDYRPLQIILSDDCSSDSTFEIMKEEAEAAPPEVELLVTRSAKNLGIGRHINRVVEKSKGEILVVAAGDDISEPQRTRVSVSALLNDPCHRLVLHGKVRKISAKGEELGFMDNPYIHILTDPVKVVRAMAWLTGTTVALRRELVTRFPPLLEKIVNEDMVWAFRSALLGGSVYLVEPYVHYRVGVGISSFNSHGDVVQENLRRKVRLERELAVLEQMQIDISAFSAGNVCSPQIADQVGKSIRQCQLQLEFIRKPCIRSGVDLLFRTRSFSGSMRVILRHLWPTLFSGLRNIKRMVARQHS